MVNGPRTDDDTADFFPGQTPCESDLSHGCLFLAGEKIQLIENLETWFSKMISMPPAFETAFHIHGVVSAVLSGKKSSCQRRPDHDANSIGCSHGKKFAFDAAVQKMI